MYIVHNLRGLEHTTIHGEKTKKSQGANRNTVVDNTLLHSESGLKILVDFVCGSGSDFSFFCIGSQFLNLKININYSHA